MVQFRWNTNVFNQIAFQRIGIECRVDHVTTWGWSGSPKVYETWEKTQESKHDLLKKKKYIFFRKKKSMLFFRKRLLRPVWVMDGLQTRCPILKLVSGIIFLGIKDGFVSKGLFTCSILASIVSILVSIEIILTSIEPILKKCVHLQQ